MNAIKRKKLEAAGWRVGSVAEFLDLSEADALIVEFRLALGQALKRRRTQLGISQQALATKLKSSQSRVAKMEAADATVSLDLLVRGLAMAGATRQDLARVLMRAG